VGAGVAVHPCRLAVVNAGESDFSNPVSGFVDCVWNGNDYRVQNKPAPDGIVNNHIVNILFVHK